MQCMELNVEKTITEFVNTWMDRREIKDVLRELGESTRGKRPALADRLIKALLDADPDVEKTARKAIKEHVLVEWEEALDDLVLSASTLKSPEATVLDALFGKVDSNSVDFTLDEVQGETDQGDWTFVSGEDFIEEVSAAIRSAESHLVYCTYVLSSRDIVEALKTAADNAVDVIIVLGAQKRVGEKNKRVAKEIQKDIGDVRVVTGRVHAKFLSIDDEYVLFGSSNGTPNHSFEVNVRLESPRLAQQLRKKVRELVTSGRLADL